MLESSDLENKENCTIFTVNTDQTAWMFRLICIFIVHTGIKQAVS